LACCVYKGNYYKYFMRFETNFLALSVVYDYRPAFCSNDIRYIDCNLLRHRAVLTKVTDRIYKWRNSFVSCATQYMNNVSNNR
jgi:hypothetical protein